MAEEQSIDEIIKSIRAAIVEKEQKEYFAQFWEKKPKKHTEPQEEIFELSKNMMVKREDIPYRLGVWDFNDVAKKIIKKYNYYFSQCCEECLNKQRVTVKEDK